MMVKLLPVLLFTFSLSTFGEVNQDYFRTVPEAKAHVFWGRSSQEMLEPHSINVLIWNVKKAEKETWKKEFLDLGKNKDLFVLQEGYDDRNFIRTTLSFPGLRWDMGKSFTYVLYDNHATGTVLGSKAAPSLVFARHTKDLEPVTLTPKTLTVAKYPVAQRLHELLVISVHGINFTGFEAFQNNLNQIKSIVAAHTGPVIVAGDFNTRTQERMDAMKAIMKSLRLKTVVWKNGDQRMKAYLTPHYLDHGFVRGLTVKAAKVFGASTGSDHKPMTLHVRVQ